MRCNVELEVKAPKSKYKLPITTTGRGDDYNEAFKEARDLAEACFYDNGAPLTKEQRVLYILDVKFWEG